MFFHHGPTSPRPTSALRFSKKPSPGRAKEYRCSKKVIHQIDSKNDWLLFSASFMTIFALVFVLTPENASS